MKACFSPLKLSVCAVTFSDPATLGAHPGRIDSLERGRVGAAVCTNLFRPASNSGNSLSWLLPIGADTVLTFFLKRLTCLLQEADLSAPCSGFSRRLSQTTFLGPALVYTQFAWPGFTQLPPSIQKGHTEPCVTALRAYERAGGRDCVHIQELATGHRDATQSSRLPAPEAGGLPETCSAMLWGFD